MNAGKGILYLECYLNARYLNARVETADRCEEDKDGFLVRETPGTRIGRSSRVGHGR